MNMVECFGNFSSLSQVCRLCYMREDCTATALSRAESPDWQGGVKHDAGKPDWSLLPWEALEPVVEVMMFGASKYGAENWRDVPNAERRYWSAAQRHLIAHLQGESTDEESGLPHLAHAACCVLFLLALEVRQ